MEVIDATNSVLGRLSSKIAKMLLSGDNVVVVNAEKAVISGNPISVKKKFLARRQRGDRKKGPFYPRYPAQIFRRAVRGMLPWKRPKGRVAYKRLRVFADHPTEYKDVKKYEKSLKDLECKYVYLKDVSKFLGAKV